jgi:hypothetical protein
MCCNSAPPAPDYSGIAAANEKSAQYAKEAADNELAFRKQTYADAQPHVTQLYDMATKVAQQQLGDSQTAQARATDQWNTYKDTFQPIEQKMAQEAMDRGGVADQADSAGRAVADVNAQGANARAQGLRSMAAMGVNPNSGRFAAMGQQNDLAQAATAAGAATTARRQAVDQGVSLRAGAAAFGRNQVNTAGQQVGLSTNSGNSAVANTGTGANANMGWANFGAGGTGSALGAAGVAQSGQLGLGGLMNQGYATGVAANPGLDIGGLLSGGAKAYTAFSDLRLKDNIVWIGTTKKGIPLYEFNYKSEPKQRWRGVIAQEVRKVMPSAVFETPSGFLAVDYAKLGIKMERADA